MPVDVNVKLETSGVASEKTLQDVKTTLQGTLSVSDSTTHTKLDDIKTTLQGTLSVSDSTTHTKLDDIKTTLQGTIVDNLVEYVSSPSSIPDGSTTVFRIADFDSSRRIIVDTLEIYISGVNDHVFITVVAEDKNGIERSITWTMNVYPEGGSNPGDMIDLHGFLIRDILRTTYFELLMADTTNNRYILALRKEVICNGMYVKIQNLTGDNLFAHIMATYRVIT